MRLGPHPTTRRDVDVNRAPSGCADGHQPRFHGPGAGMLCCQRSLVRSDARAVSRTQPSAHRHPSQMPVRGHPRGRLGETSTPTRSARTPLVMRSGHRWVETPTVPGTAPVRELRLRRSHHTSPTPAKGRSPRAPDAPRCAGHARACPRCAETYLEAKGRISRTSAKKDEIRRTRGAFHP